MFNHAQAIYLAAEYNRLPWDLGQCRIFKEPEEPALSDDSEECTTARLLEELSEEIQEDIDNTTLEKITSTRVADHFGFFHRPATSVGIQNKNIISNAILLRIIFIKRRNNILISTHVC